MTTRRPPLVPGPMAPATSGSPPSPGSSRATLGRGGWSKPAMWPARSLSNRAALAPWGAVVGACLLAVACTASSEEVQPESDQIYFPTGLAMTPTEDRLFVLSANSELRFDSGSLTAWDLAKVDEIAAGWLANRTQPGGCRIDDTSRDILVCDEGQAGPGFILPDAGVRVGNFGTAVATQDLGDGRLRLISAVRGDPSVTWAEWDGTRIRCDGGAEGYPLCDDEHRLTRLRGDADLPALAEEPFAVATDAGSEVALVSHFTSGRVTLVDSRRAGTPILTDTINGLFEAGTSSQPGALALAARNPGQPDTLWYVGSRTEDRIQLMTVDRPSDGRPASLVLGPFFFLDSVGSSNGSSADTRAMQFGSGGDRLYLVNRQPPSLQVFDTSLAATGVPRNVGLTSTDLCREASSLVVADVGDGDRAFVSCFRDGEVYVIDPRGRASVEAIATVGRGPFALVVSTTRRKLYVSNFLEDSIAVVELSPDSPRRYQVILRLGEPRL
jgi:DNA-binding beta-propeller fold protein YncE